MAVKIWDSAAGAFTDAATPQAWDSAAGAYGGSTGLAYDAGEGAWEERWDPDKTLWLYRNGDQCTSVTGGWSKYGAWPDYNYVEIRNDSLYVKDTYPYVYDGSCPHSCITTTNMVDLTGYSRLRIIMDCVIPPAAQAYAGQVIFAPTRDRAPGADSYYEYNVYWYTRETIYGADVVWDISGMGGSWYIVVDCHTPQTEAVVYRCWAEK